MIAGFPSAHEMFQDVPRDCHRHCACFEIEGECCDCGDRQPISNAKLNFQDAQEAKELEPQNQNDFKVETVQFDALSYMDAMLATEYLGG